jgi:hypothetical protein
MTPEERFPPLEEPTTFACGCKTWRSQGIGDGERLLVLVPCELGCPTLAVVSITHMGGDVLELEWLEWSRR